MATDDTLLLVTTSGISSEFEDFGSEVFEDSSEQPECASLGGPWTPLALG
jgi:hypothetical protein